MGRGILLAGVPGVAPAHITILGGGVVGANAAKIAAGFRADVAILDINMERLRYLDDVMPPNVDCLFSDRHTIREQLSRADLVIGAVLIPGAKAPMLVSKEDLKPMKPGSVIIDVAIDQGGCIATSRPTSHSNPTYMVDEVLHYCVTNMPGAVGRTSTFALCNVTLPWVIAIAERGIEAAARDLRPVARAINLAGGEVTNKPVAETFGLHATRRGSRWRSFASRMTRPVMASLRTPCSHSHDIVRDDSLGRRCDGHLVLLDQTRLPAKTVYLDCRTVEDVWQAIKRLSVRGAPAIGVAAAYGVCVGVNEGRDVDEVCDYLATSRPTAVNLFWALERMRRASRASSAQTR